MTSKNTANSITLILWFCPCPPPLPPPPDLSRFIYIAAFLIVILLFTLTKPGHITFKWQIMYNIFPCFLNIIPRNIFEDAIFGLNFLIRILFRILIENSFCSYSQLLVSHQIMWENMSNWNVYEVFTPHFIFTFAFLRSVWKELLENTGLSFILSLRIKLPLASLCNFIFAHCPALIKKIMGFIIKP